MIIQGIRITEEVLTTRFACDYEACKGWCCYGGNPEDFDGPPVTRNESDKILAHKERLHELVEDDAKELAEEPIYHYEEDPSENYIEITPKGKCIYCSLDSKGCIIKEYKESLYPRHCGLYPIGVEEKEGVKSLVVLDDHGEICDPARVKGEKENIYVVRFCKDAIIREFGKSFYDELESKLPPA